MEDLEWHCPHCLYAGGSIHDAVDHLLGAHDIDIVEAEDAWIVALDDPLSHEIAEMIADSGGRSVEEFDHELAKEIVAKVDEFRGGPPRTQ